MELPNLSPWDLGRFAKTLAYFGALPFLSGLSCVQQWLGSQPHPSVDSQAIAQQLQPQEQNIAILFDFQNPTADLRETWGTLDDVVMGGVSESSLRVVDGAALFRGTVSTANSGGFASVRTRNFEPPLDLSAYTGILLKVKGDGQRYKFILRDRPQWDSAAYSTSFDTVADSWLEVRLPFTEFRPFFRAKTVRNARPLETQAIRSLQLMLSKFEYDGDLNPHFQPGSFQLQVASIQAYQ